MEYTNKVYLGTVLLEKNRWSICQPSFLVSKWVKKIAEAGFDGIELWQNHALLATKEERERLKNSPVPMIIFNSYADCDNKSVEERNKSTDMVYFFSSGGMKFNFGENHQLHSEYLKNVKEWRKTLPESFRMLCECHGSTTMEEPEIAGETLKQMGTGNIQVIVHAFAMNENAVRKRFKYLGSNITHVHVAMSSQDNKFIRLSKDSNFVKERFGLLKELGFRGSFTIEFTEGVAEPGENINMLFKNAREDMEFLRKNLL